MHLFFFAVFWNIPLQNQKKWHPKKWPFPISIQTTHQKYQYTLIHQKSRFWKITPTSHTVRFYLTHHNRTRFFHFSPKKIDKFTIIHRIFVFFWNFFKITIFKPHVIYQNCVINTLAKYFFYFPAKSPYIEQILWKKTHVVKYTADFE